MQNKKLIILTRTPLHVGAGASVGAIDQPVQRERHTGLPIIPASSLKGSFADQWPLSLRDEENNLARITARRESGRQVVAQIDPSGAAWLFGSDNAHLSFAGSLLFFEARLLAFPIRSAKGGYGWITSPLMLERAARDGIIDPALVENLPEPKDNQAIFKKDGPLTAANSEIVLEEYCFSAAESSYPANLAEALANRVDDKLFQSITERLVILSNGMMSFLVTAACDVAQHVRINDETGTAEAGGLFNQENVPADTLFYSLINAVDSRVPVEPYKDKRGSEALDLFQQKINENKVFQFGADASIGLGFCSVTIQP